MEDYSISIGTDYQTLFRSKILSDLSFTFDQNYPEIPAHQMVVALFSDFFKEILYPDNVSKREKFVVIRLELKGLSINNFLKVLQFCYTGKIGLNMRNFQQICQLSWQFRINRLIQVCQKFVKKNNLPSITTKTIHKKKRPSPEKKQEQKNENVKENEKEIEIEIEIENEKENQKQVENKKKPIKNGIHQTKQLQMEKVRNDQEVQNNEGKEKEKEKIKVKENEKQDQKGQEQKNEIEIESESSLKNNESTNEIEKSLLQNLQQYKGKETTQKKSVLPYVVEKNNFQIQKIQTQPVGIKVALIVADKDMVYVQNVATTLSMLGVIETIRVFRSNKKNYAYEQIKNMDVAFVYSSDSQFYNAERLGNDLADFVEDGGGLVMCAINCLDSSDDKQLEGRITTPEYLPIVKNDSLNSEYQNLGKIETPSHPVIRDVNIFNGGRNSFRINVKTVTNDSTVIAYWDDGTVFAAEKHFPKKPSYGKVIALNLWPPNSDSDPNCWNSDSDGKTLLLNSIMYVANYKRNDLKLINKLY
ncbi:hypothetical protein M0812_05947 [Anaeramoeba flamelloides]|uniref:BTB domain-containing protein n=1 Tax=Anaeramoeba flamelloides TaxID=1746091 RepID=A0AAV8A7K1_9EUKA|nr:hypothetical protein M0812_05947 [Anaeramoeba flamelloides]